MPTSPGLPPAISPSSSTSSMAALAAEFDAPALSRASSAGSANGAAATDTSLDDLQARLNALMGGSPRAESPAQPKNSSVTPFQPMEEDTAKFGKTLGSVLQNGIMSQAEMREANQDFKPSNDGGGVERKNIDVLRYAKETDSDSAKNAVNEGLTSSNNGALSITMESQPAVPTQKTKINLSDKTDAEIEKMMAKEGMVGVPVDVYKSFNNGKVEIKLDPDTGPDEAAKRMAMSFLVLAKADDGDGIQGLQGRTKEVTRSPIKPDDIEKVLIPKQFEGVAKATAEKVGFPQEKLEFVDSVLTSAALKPEVKISETQTVEIPEGVVAPDYGPAIEESIKQGSKDQHIVRA